ncbi:MAG: hypothetical protein HYV28_05200 [Ignavibacteriales bacterium]|nr:hypothetical protein [Ignavibacteriales bacterium]
MKITEIVQIKVEIGLTIVTMNKNAAQAGGVSRMRVFVFGYFNSGILPGV